MVDRCSEQKSLFIGYQFFKLLGMSDLCRGNERADVRTCFAYVFTILPARTKITLETEQLY
jgi:hypothetical protein